MKEPELTDRPELATTLPMQDHRRTGNRVSGRRVAQAAAVLAGGSMLLGGCVSVNAPDKPIVIELNINIKQEVIYRLAQDAGNTIDKNKDIF